MERRRPVSHPDARREHACSPRSARAVLLPAAFLITLAGASRAEPLRIQHSPSARAHAWSPLAIEAVLPGDVRPERVATADVIVATSEGELRAIPLSLSRNALFGEIPGPLVAPPEISYYLRLVGTEGVIVTLPSGAPEGGLFVVPVAPDTAGARGDEDVSWVDGSVEIVNPAPGEVVAGALPQIAALIEPPLEDPWDALVVLDGEDVTESAEIAPRFLVLAPPETLEVGAHRITFSAVTAVRTVEASWVFFVRERVAAADHWPSATASFPYVEPPTERWDIVGRLELGWATVTAETTAVETLDVFLPYEEVSRPIIDLYASGVRGSRSFLATAQYNPVYGDELEWLLNARGESFEIDGGNIFPSLSRTTLDWAAGLGARLSARIGASATDLVGIRMSEADTVAGFGVYSRFAIGAKETFDWNEHLSTSLVYLSVFDREESVPEEQRLTDPLRNDVLAGLVRARAGKLAGEIELGRSSVDGDLEGSGNAVRARVGLERDLDNRLSLEYASSEPEYYSAGSFEYEPGERAFEIEYAYRPGESLKTSGWARVGRTLGARSTLAEDELEFKIYGRAELSWELARGEARAYAVARHDRTPNEAYEYRYSYGALGGTWRRGRTRAIGSVSWSRSHSPEATDLWTAAADLRQELIARRWTARVAGRWTAATGDAETDYRRAHYTLETRWDFGEVDLEAEYRRIDRDDRADPDRSYTEHVVVLTAGRAF